MRFVFTEEQDMLASSIRKFLEAESPPKKVREWEAGEKGFSLDVYRTMAGLGYLGLIIPEDYGGMGLSFMDLGILYEEMGRCLFPSPHYETCVLGALAILAYGTEKQKKEYLPRIASGDLILTIACRDKEEGVDSMNVCSPGLLRGKKLFVPWANSVDSILTLAGGNLYIVDAKNTGVSSSPVDIMSGDKVYEVTYQAVKPDGALGPSGKGEEIVSSINDRGKVAIALKMVGGAKKALEMAAQYAKERIQFDRPIGGFQAIQHMLARVAMEVEGARLLAYEAAWALSRESKEWRKLAGMAKYWANYAYYRSTKECHQVLGGFGFMAETDMQLFYRRAKGLEMNYGQSGEQLEQVARLL